MRHSSTPELDPEDEFEFELGERVGFGEIRGFENEFRPVSISTAQKHLI